jgi:hypothetical protein
MWDFNYITWFKFSFTNSGLSLSTWLGDFNIPMRTFILIALAVIILRVRKRVRDAVKQRNTNKVVATPQPENPFKLDWDL